MIAFILAAGHGSRFRPHTEHLPKPAIPFLGVPLFKYNLSFLCNLNLSKIIVNSFHLHHLMESAADKVLSCQKVPFSFSRESNFIRGSAGALKFAETLIKDSWNTHSDQTILLMNADEVYYPTDPLFLNHAYAQHLASNSLATAVVMKHPEVGSKFGGIWTDSKKRIVRIGMEKPFVDCEGFHFIGYQFLSSKIFDYLKEDKESNIFYDVINSAIVKGDTCSVYEVDGHWFEMGNLKDYLLATEESLNLYSKLQYINSFLRANWPSHKFHIKNDSTFVLADQSSRFNINQISNFAVLGEDVELDPQILLNRTVIYKKGLFSHSISNELIL